MKRLAALLLAGCGYHAVAGGAPPSEREAQAEGSSGSGAEPQRKERFAVVLSHTNVPDAVASDEVLAGVREELSRVGALKTGDGYPRCEIEVLRADESSDGIAAVRDPAHGGGLQPVARGTRVGLVARAWIVREKDGTRERDTGDVRALDEVAVASDARASSFQYTDAMRAAGRRVGHSLGAHIVGLPSTTE